MIRVGIIRGGTDDSFNESLETGSVLLAHIDRTKFEPHDILLDTDGYHTRGLRTSMIDIAKRVDVIWNAVHETNHALMQSLEQTGMPYVGQQVFSHAIATHRRMAKNQADTLGIQVPDDVHIPDYRTQDELDRHAYIDEAASFVFKRMPPPWFVMPMKYNPINQPFVARTVPELIASLQILSEEPGDMLVEEYIAGRKLSVVVADNFRNERTYAFLPVEYKEKESLLISPARLEAIDQKSLALQAKKMYEQLGLRHYGELHFILSPKGLHFTHANTQPVWHERGTLSKSFEPVGSSIQEFITHTLDLVLGKK
jgi:D-alanine-D-alanine ligase-like ATP-grasp enzyme